MGLAPDRHAEPNRRVEEKQGRADPAPLLGNVEFAKDPVDQHPVREAEEDVHTLDQVTELGTVRGERPGAAHEQSSQGADPGEEVRDAGLVRKRDLDPRDPIPDTSQ